MQVIMSSEAATIEYHYISLDADFVMPLRDSVVSVAVVSKQPELSRDCMLKRQNDDGWMHSISNARTGCPGDFHFFSSFHEEQADSCVMSFTFSKIVDE